MSSAAEHGVSTVLDGHGGDEVISGQGLTRLFELARSGAWVRFILELYPLSRRQKSGFINAALGIYGNYGPGRVAKACRRLRSIIHKPGSSRSQPEWLAPCWENDERTKERLAPFRKWEVHNFENERVYQQWVLSSPLQAYAFEIQNRGFRHWGLEVEFPFWDYDVVELCLRMPSSEKLSQGWDRNLIRTVMKGVLPEKVRLRTDKLDFGGHLVRGLLRDRDYLRDLVDEAGPQLAKYVNPAAVIEYIDRLEDCNWEERGRAAGYVWRGASIAIWFQYLRTVVPVQSVPLEVRI
jgi:asparagine synthase (glutamine-hydrolysing)